MPKYRFFATYPDGRFEIFTAYRWEWADGTSVNYYYEDGFAVFNGGGGEVILVPASAEIVRGDKINE